MKNDLFNKKLGEIIRDNRKAKQMTMKELGERINVTEGAIHLYEIGKRTMSPDVFFSICKILDIDVNDTYKKVSKYL